MVGPLFFFCFVLLASGAEIPGHVHLFLTGNLSTLQISFTNYEKPASPGVTYWASTAPSSPKDVYARHDEIHYFVHPVDKHHEYITSVTIDVDRAATYSYYAFSDKDDAASRTATFTFNTIPDEDSDLKIGIYGDMGAYGSAILEKGKGGLPYWASNHLFDFIIHNGDLAYNLGTKLGSIGREFQDNIQQVSALVPYMVTPGNHEFMDESEIYYKNWFLGQTSIGTTSGSTDETMWYSFDVGIKLHVVVISTEVYCEDTGNIAPQYAWLEKNLAEVRTRKVQPWVIVLGHRQMYINDFSSLHSRLMRYGLQCKNATLEDCDVTVPCTDGKYCGYSIEKLFRDYKVDIYFAGHMHTYVRMFPISSDLTYETQDKEKYVNAQNPVYIVSGAAGAQDVPHKSDEMEKLMKRGVTPTAHAVGGHTFSYLQVINHTYLAFHQINVTDGTYVDRFTMHKDHSQPEWKKRAHFDLARDNQTKCDQ